MNKINGIFRILLVLTIMNSNETFAQFPNVSVVDGILSFNDRAEYESIVESDETEKIEFYESLNEVPGFKSLRASEENESSIPDSLFESAEFITNIVNYQGVVKVGVYYYKIDYTKGMTYSLPEEKVKEYFNDLLSGHQTADNQLGVFSIEADVIDLTESGYKSDPSEEDIDGEERLFCWGGSRATASRYKIALYFRDLSDPKNATFGSCVNFYDGRPVANRRLKVKLEYISLGIYHRLDIDGKLQAPGQIGVNGIPLWTTRQWGVGESNWNLKFDVMYRGRCRKDNDISQSNVILNPPLNSENKTRKVFWERARGLRYYCLKADASIFTNNFFTGPSSDASFCADTDNIRASDPPRLMNSTELPPFTRYIIYSRTTCQ